MSFDPINRVNIRDVQMALLSDVLFVKLVFSGTDGKTVFVHPITEPRTKRGKLSAPFLPTEFDVPHFSFEAVELDGTHYSVIALSKNADAFHPRQPHGAWADESPVTPALLQTRSRAETYLGHQARATTRSRS